MLNFWRSAIAWPMLWLVVSSASAQIYKADLTASEWKAISTPSICSITHPIPGLGKAVFVHSVGKGATFYIELHNKGIVLEGEVKIETLPPVWRTDIASVNIGNVIAVAGNQPIKMQPAHASMVLAQLNDRVNIIFTSNPNAANNKAPGVTHGLGSLSIVLEAKNFAEAYKNYQQCTGEYVAPAVKSSDKNTDIFRMRHYIQRDAALGVTVKGHASSRAKDHIFAADIMNADWKSVSTPFTCRITHNIPGFGKANLSQKGGNGEVFYIETDGKIVFPVGVTSIDTLPPVWRNTSLPVSVGTVMAVTGHQPITLRANNITPMVSHLSSGVKVMFTSLDVMDNKNPNAFVMNSGAMRVVLEAKNFATAYKDYQKCRGELIDYTFAQVSRTLINYSEQYVGLSASTKIELTKVARYMKADPNVLRILVDAHSDNAEATKINEETSKQYAEWVTDYLVKKGIAMDKIINRWHGEKFPVASNKTAMGRAQNRRVTVRLETDETRQENTKNAAAKKAALEAEKLNPNKGKITPQDINDMVDGLDLIPAQ